MYGGVVMNSYIVLNLVHRRMDRSGVHGLHAWDVSKFSAVSCAVCSVHVSDEHQNKYKYTGWIPDIPNPGLIFVF